MNDLVAGPAPLHLVIALYITDDGLIAGAGVPPGVSVYDVETLVFDAEETARLIE